MTLAEKIVRELRRKKDMGMTSEMLASALHINTCKIATAAEALMEQEHLILGGDRCWYLGDAEAAGAAYVPAPEPALAPFIASGLETLRALIDPLQAATAPPPMEEAPDLIEETVREVLEQITPEMTMDPFGFQVKPPLVQKKKPAKVKANQSNQFGKLPAWIRLKTWVETRPHHAMPISWAELSKELDIIKTTLGKARSALLDRGEIELIAKLDRLVYQKDPKSIKRRASVEPVKGIHQEQAYILDEVPGYCSGPIIDDFNEFRQRLKKTKIHLLPGPVSEYIRVLDEVDSALVVYLDWGSERPMRKRIAELKAWLLDLPQ